MGFTGDFMVVSIGIWGDTNTGWWWLEHDFYFFIQLGIIIIPIDELIFFRGLFNHQPVSVGYPQSFLWDFSRIHWNYFTSCDPHHWWVVYHITYHITSHCINMSVFRMSYSSCSCSRGWSHLQFCWLWHGGSRSPQQRCRYLGLDQNYGTNDPRKWSCLVGKPSILGVDNFEP